MATIENPQITMTELNALEELVKENKAQSEDYERLNSYLNFLGFGNYLISRLKQSNINSFEDFIYIRKKGRQPLGDTNMIVGSVLGVISFLRKHISGKL